MKTISLWKKYIPESQRYCIWSVLDFVLFINKDTFEFTARYWGKLDQVFVMPDIESEEDYFQYSLIWNENLYAGIDIDLYRAILTKVRSKEIVLNKDPTDAEFIITY